MSKKSQVASSIFVISIIIFPAFFVLGIVLPNFIYDLSTVLFGDCSDFFTGLGIALLIMLLIPPWRKHQRAVVSKTWKTIMKKFFKSEPKDEVVFKDDIVRFAATEYLANDSDFKNDLIKEVLKSTENYSVEQSSQAKEENLLDLTKYRQFKLRNLNKTSFPNLDLTNFLTNINFELNPTLFLELFYSNFAPAERLGFGGDKRNSQFPIDFSLYYRKLNNRCENNG